MTVNKKYLTIFQESADIWGKVTPSVIQTMFIKADNRQYLLKSFKNWLLKQPLTDYTKGRVEGIYQDFITDKKEGI